MNEFFNQTDLQHVVDVFKGLSLGGKSDVHVYGPTIKKAKEILGDDFSWTQKDINHFEIYKNSLSETTQSKVKKAMEVFDGNEIELECSVSSARPIVSKLNKLLKTNLSVKIIDNKPYLVKKDISVRKMVSFAIESGSDKLFIDHSDVSDIAYLRTLCYGRGYSPIKTDTGYIVIRKDILDMERKRQQIADMQSKLNAMIAEFEKEYGGFDDDDEIID